MPPSSAAAGVLVIRAWIESPDAVRVRVTSKADVLEEEALTLVTTSVEEVCEHVRRWLEDYRRANA